MNNETKHTQQSTPGGHKTILSLKCKGVTASNTPNDTAIMTPMPYCSGSPNRGSAALPPLASNPALGGTHSLAVSPPSRPEPPPQPWAFGISPGALSACCHRRDLLLSHCLRIGLGMTSHRSRARHRQLHTPIHLERGLQLPWKTRPAPRSHSSSTSILLRHCGVAQFCQRNDCIYGSGGVRIFWQLSNGTRQPAT